MAVILMIEAARPEWITIRPSPLAELCAALHALDEPEHHPESGAWLSAVHKEFTDDLLTRATVWAPLWGAFRARYLLPLTTGPERSLDAELAEVARLPVDAFAALTLEALIGKNRAAGEPSQEPTEVLRRLRLISLRRYDLGLRLIGEPARFRDELLEVLAAFGSTLFDKEWRRVRADVEADTQTRQRQLHLHGVAAAFDGIGTVSGDGPPRVIVEKLYHATARLDERTPGVLVPSVHGAPHVVVKHAPGFPVVVQYPVLQTSAPVSVEEAQRRLAVLADPTRLRICQNILRHPAATAELAARLGMTSPQVSRHLRRLREAGLVSTHRHGAAVYYRLNVEAIGRLGPDLLAGLHH
ncbi:MULTISPECIES: DUF5937 family protein [unclassified Streptomyces]|uniref:ArsR/SmtB family transcription factor n=1 Tax=Streptomyces TaxID=1883 RepID=UPI0021D95F50|nr:MULTISPECIES: DUF5937 family protein [unclassified Streptomyces]